MSNFLVFLAGVLPAAVLVFYIYMRDKYQREPLSCILKAVGYGVACAIPAILIELFLTSLSPELKTPTLGGALYEGFIVAALSEESMKLLFLWLFLRKNPYFDERMDCIVYACCVSMGFAGLENVGYLFDNIEELAEVATMRAILSVPGHFFYAVFMGYFMSMAIWGRPRLRTLNWVLTLLVPVFLHGVYDACLMSMPVSDDVMAMALFVFIILGLYVWVVGHKHIKRLLIRDARNPIRPATVQSAESSDSTSVSSATTDGYMKDEKGSFLVQPAIAVETSASDEAVTEPLEEARQVSYVMPDNDDSGRQDFTNKGIFLRPFSFHGRIRRREYVGTFVIYLLWYILLVPNDDVSSSGGYQSENLFLITLIPMIWFYIAQGCKRCHDLGHSGWWQLIPYYFIIMLFSKGDAGNNEYGDSPREED